MKLNAFCIVLYCCIILHLQLACCWLVAVLDEEDSTITTGSIVTVTVNLVRKDMAVLFEIPAIEQIDEDETAVNGNVDEDGEEDEDHDHDHDHDERQVIVVFTSSPPNDPASLRLSPPAVFYPFPAPTPPEGRSGISDVSPLSGISGLSV